MFGRKRSEREQVLHGEISKLSLAPGDVLVFKSDDPISDAVAKRIEEQLGFLFPNNKKLVLERGSDISILGKAAGKERLGDETEPVA